MTGKVSDTARGHRPNGFVLVVDDEDAIRTVVGRALGRVGWQVEQAEDGPSALRLLRSSDFSWKAIILDLSLPGMSGEQLFEAIRDERPELVPRLAFTSGAPSVFAEESGRPLLHKPFEIDELRVLVRQLAAGS